MANTSIQKSLIELEENLKSLRSARDQVESVTNGVEDVLISIKELIEIISLLSNNVTSEKVLIESKLNDALSSFSESINSGAIKAIEDYEKLSDKNQNLQKKLDEKLSEALDAFSVSIKEGSSKAIKDYEDVTNNIEKYQHEIKSKFHDAFEDFNSTLNEGISKNIQEFEALSKENEKAIAKSIEAFESLTSNLFEIQNKLKEFDPRDSVKDVIKKVAVIEEKLSDIQAANDEHDKKTTESLSNLELKLNNLIDSTERSQRETAGFNRVNRMLILISAGIGLIAVILAVV